MNPEDVSVKGTASVEGAQTTAATPAAAAEPLTETRIRDELKNVVDPEIGIDMVNLGLLYGVQVSDGNAVQVTMTLTTPGCPVAGMFMNSVHAAVMSIPGVSDCKVDLTFSPPWDPRTMASEEAKMMLGIYY